MIDYVNKHRHKPIEELSLFHLLNHTARGQ